MKVEYSPSDISRWGCGSTVSNTSIGSMVVEIDSNNPPSDISLGWGCGSTPNLTTAVPLSTGSCDSMKVEYNASDRSATSADSLKVEYNPSDQSSTTSINSMNVEYTRSAQSELWEDILQRLGVEAEKETGWLVHPEYCGCLGCLKEA